MRRSRRRRIRPTEAPFDSQSHHDPLDLLKLVAEKCLCGAVHDVFIGTHLACPPAALKLKGGMSEFAGFGIQNNFLYSWLKVRGLALDESRVIHFNDILDDRRWLGYAAAKNILAPCPTRDVLHQESMQCSCTRKSPDSFQSAFQAWRSESFPGASHHRYPLCFPHSIHAAAIFLIFPELSSDTGSCRVIA